MRQRKAPSPTPTTVSSTAEAYERYTETLKRKNEISLLTLQARLRKEAYELYLKAPYVGYAPDAIYDFLHKGTSLDGPGNTE